MKFTVLVPTHANGAVIRNALDSVLEQTLAEFELFIVGDGAPPETLAILDEYAAGDRRVRAFKYDKGERHGEALRHLALLEADSDAVCYLSDDDFWFPDHLEMMAGLLTDFEFAHTRQISVLPWHAVHGYAHDIGEAAVRERMAAERFNFFGLSVVGHRLDAYRRLPVGWSPAPEDIWTDLHMWRKFVAAEAMRFASSTQITGLHFPRARRRDQPAAAAFYEVAYWRQAFADPGMREALRASMPADDVQLPLYEVAARARELQQRR